MFADFNEDVDAHGLAAKPRRRVGLEADFVLAGFVRGEREAALGIVHLVDDQLALGILRGTQCASE